MECGGQRQRMDVYQAHRMRENKQRGVENRTASCQAKRRASVQMAQEERAAAGWREAARSQAVARVAAPTRANAKKQSKKAEKAKRQRAKKAKKRAAHSHSLSHSP